MTIDDMPEGVRIVLIHGLELCGAVLRGDPASAIREQAEVMYLVASEHISTTEGDGDGDTE